MRRGRRIKEKCFCLGRVLLEGNGLNGQRIVRNVCVGGSQHSVATLTRAHTHIQNTMNRLQRTKFTVPLHRPLLEWLSTNLAFCLPLTA